MVIYFLYNQRFYGQTANVRSRFETLFVFSHFQVASQLDKKAKITKDQKYDLLELAIFLKFEKVNLKSQITWHTM